MYRAFATIPNGPTYYIPDATNNFKFATLERAKEAADAYMNRPQLVNLFASGYEVFVLNMDKRTVEAWAIKPNNRLDWQL